MSTSCTTMSKKDLRLIEEMYLDTCDSEFYKDHGRFVLDDPYYQDDYVYDDDGYND